MLEDIRKLKTNFKDSSFLIDILSKLECSYIFELYLELVNPQSYSGAIEKRWIEINKYTKLKSNTECGDYCNNGANVEFKFTYIRGNGYHFVQIRPFHDVDRYDLMCYTSGTGFKVFKIKKAEMATIIDRFGKYAHGCKHRKATETTEYALRGTQGDLLWKELEKASI